MDSAEFDYFDATELQQHDNQIKAEYSQKIITIAFWTVGIIGVAIGVTLTVLFYQFAG